MVAEYPDDIRISITGMEIIRIEEFHKALDDNLRFSKSQRTKELMDKVWADIKDK